MNTSAADVSLPGIHSSLFFLQFQISVYFTAHLLRCCADLHYLWVKSDMEEDRYLLLWSKSLPAHANCILLPSLRLQGSCPTLYETILKPVALPCMPGWQIPISIIWAYSKACSLFTWRMAWNQTSDINSTVCSLALCVSLFHASCLPAWHTFRLVIKMNQNTMCFNYTIRSHCGQRSSLN